MVRRVFTRTGFVKKDTLSNVINAARSLHAEYPGELDFPSWDIGRRWCLNTSPKCGLCVLNNVCLKEGA
jgi:endonuclease III